MIRRFDAWVGKHLFVPPIIFICQRTPLTQITFGNYAFMLTWWLILAMTVEMDGLLKMPFWTGGIVLATSYVTISVARDPAKDRSRMSSPGWRMFNLANLIGGFVSGVLARGSWDLGDPALLVFQFALYAWSIKTIPPLEAGETARKLAREGA